MSTDIHQYRCFCQTENCLVYTWSAITPITCPNNNTHTIDPQSVVIVDTRSSNIVIPGNDESNVQGFFSCQGFTLNVAPGPDTKPQKLTPLQQNPYNTRVATITFLPKEENIGDIVSLYSAVDTLCGVITTAIGTPGNTGNFGSVISVSPTVIQNVGIGFSIDLFDSQNNVSQNVGQILSIDQVNSTITVSYPITNYFSPGSYVQFSIPRITNINIGSTNPLTFGLGKNGSSLLPANIASQISYTNNSNTTKTFSFYGEITF